MSLSQHISILCLSKSNTEKLLSNGFCSLNDLSGMQPIQLAKEVDISVETAHQILKSVASVIVINSSGMIADANNSSSSSSFGNDTNRSSVTDQEYISSLTNKTLPTSNTMKILSARDLISLAANEKPIITYSKAIDTMLGGGIVIGQIVSSIFGFSFPSFFIQ